MNKLTSILITILIFTLAAFPVSAQTPEPPPGPVYIVQEGDTLWDIAIRFNVSVNDLLAYNNLPSQDLYVGDRLVIPGLETLSGILTIQPVPFGESLRSLSRQNNVDPALLIKLNRIVSPAELYAGYGLILLQQENASVPTGRASLLPGETLLELAVRQGTRPWTLAQVNGLDRGSAALPGDVFAIPGGETTTAPSGFPSAVTSAELDPLPITQGQTAQVGVTLNQTAALGGLLVDRPLNFFQTDGGTWIALQGVHVMTEPGIYPFRLDVTLPDGTTQSFEQMVMIEDGYFRQDPVLQVEPSTIDPAVTEPENEFLYSLVASATPEKLWQGIFQLPVDEQFCLRSMYGNRRSYNGSDFIYFHTGVDYGNCSESHPFDVYAPAAGTVIFAGALTVRGNATIIDHGWGVYSGLWHQEEIYVAVSDRVEAGQLIGKIGATGRVTGPHLHWEVWANGIQVNPLQWLEEVFPHP
jgi:murein DD-endopeptidase MepM/ murein hydrolase activator NlpD